MEIARQAFAGSLESSDVFVEVAPGGQTVEIEIDSVVMEQFGSALRETVEDMMKQFGVLQGKISLRDRGALECTVRARIETALRRAEAGGKHA